MVGIAAVFLSDQVKRKIISTELEPEAQHRNEFDSGKPYIWLFGIVGGFAMSSIIVVFDTLFPVYALRQGLTLSMIGLLSGLKMVLAAIIRPFSGQILAHISAVKITHWSMGGLTLSALILPFAGIGAGLFLIIGMMGLSFGASRVTTAALALDGSFDSDLVSRRISVYTVTLSIAQSIGPFIAGWVAYWFDVPIAIAGIPVVVILLYAASLLVIPNLTLPTAVVTLKRTAH